MNKNNILSHPELIGELQKASAQTSQSKILLRSIELSSEPKNHSIAVIASNDTHIHLFKRLLQEYSNYTLFTIAQKKESAENEANKQELSFNQISFLGLNLLKFDCLLTSNDWGTYERYFVSLFNMLGKPTYVLQESVIDFSPKLKKMRHSQVRLVQGVPSALLLQDEKYVIITGNPRYEQLLQAKKIVTKELPLKIAVNVNFTYGVEVNSAKSWIEDITKLKSDFGYEVNILKHPRDQTPVDKLNIIQTNANKIHEALLNHDILITRFSSLIHEAMHLGLLCIYYNPHGENLCYNFEMGSKNLKICNSFEELSDTIQNIVNNPISNSIEGELMFHCGCTDGQASKRINDIIKNFKTQKIKNKWRFIFYPIYLIAYLYQLTKHYLISSINRFYKTYPTINSP